MDKRTEFTYAETVSKFTTIRFKEPKTLEEAQDLFYEGWEDAYEVVSVYEKNRDSEGLY